MKHQRIRQHYRYFLENPYKNLIDLFESVHCTDEIILEQLRFYCGLSYFNCRDYENATDILKKLSSADQDNYKFFTIIAELHLLTKKYVDGKNENKLIELLNDLKDLQDTAIYKKNQEIALITSIITCFYISRSNKDYYKITDQYYENAPEGIRKNCVVTYFYGMTLELRDKLDEAINLYRNNDWKSSVEIAHRLIMSYIQLQKYDEAINVYQELGFCDARTDGVYIFAKSHIVEKKEYTTELKAFLVTYNSLEELFNIVFYIEDGTTFKTDAVDAIRHVLDEGNSFSDLDLSIKVGYAYAFSHYGVIDLLKVVLDEIEELSYLGDLESHAIYKCIFSIIGNKGEFSSFDVPDDITLSESIIDRFLSEGVHRDWFLQLKIMASNYLSKPFSMLKYSKELYELRPDLETASNILGMLLQQNKTDINEYTLYLNALRQSNEPIHLINVAFALQRLGQDEEADFCAYKALYLLNGQDDYDIYSSFCLFHFSKIKNEPIPLKKSKSVVTLSSMDGSKEWVVCLDEEAELSTTDNHSFKIEHINRNNKYFAKIVSSSKGQRLVIDGQTYTVNDFVPRSVFALQYVLSIIQNNQQAFSGKSIWTVSGNTPEEMLEKIKELTDNQERIKNLIDLYTFKDGGIGIPIDSFVHGDYSNYIDTVRRLLYTPELAFYAGEPSIEDEFDSKYVITISSLVLLCIHGWLSILDPIKERLMCPEGYYQFFHKLYEHETNTQQISPGKLVTLEDGRAVMLDNDKSLPDVWEKIWDFCQELKQVHIADEERISYDIIDGLKGERFFSELNFDVVQLDAFIAAEKMNATYICDDLFFRRLAAFKKMKNINVTSLLYNHIDWDVAVPIIKDLSKSNYIYTPFIHRNQDDAREIIGNLMNGKIKKEIYGEFFRLYYSYIRAYLKELFAYSVDENDIES